KRNAERLGEAETQGCPYQLPGPDPRVERTTEHAALLTFRNDLGQQRLAVQVEGAYTSGDLLVVGLDQGAMHDAELQGVFARRAEIDIDDGMELGERVGEQGGFRLPAMQGGLANLLEDFQEQGFLALEMAIKDRLGHPRGLGDLLGGGGLIP